MKAISAQHVSKTFQFKTHRGIKGFFSRDAKTVKAVNDITLEVEQGESLAFIGPNGAGKSTTIKMLTGILQPIAGQIAVLGLSPMEQRRELAQQIGIVFGQRSQLIFNLPLTDSFTLTASMYRVPENVAKQRIRTLIGQFDLASFLEQPVRKLSLGQRMRAEVANALIHQPKIIFLDEPTIGLDIVAKRALRSVIRQVNQELGTTIFLTSHDVGDIEEVCDRTVIVNHGQIVLDERTANLKTDYLRTKTVSVVPEGEPQPVEVAGFVPQIKDGRLIYTLDTSKQPLKAFMRGLLDHIEIADITVEDAQLEDIIHELYTKERAHEPV